MLNFIHYQSTSIKTELLQPATYKPTVSGGLAGGSLVNAQIAGVVGQNAVENNELVQRTPESVMQNIEKRKEKIKSEVCTSGMSQAACNKAIAAEFDRNNAEFGKMLIDLATLVPGISEADALSILLNEKTLSGDETSRIWGAIGIITAGYGQKLRLAGKGLRALNPAEELVTSTGHVIKNAEANAIKSESREVGKEAAKAGKGTATNSVASELIEITQKQLDKKFKHAADFGIITTKKNPETLSQYEAAIKNHMGNTATKSQGTYGFVTDSKVFFNPNTNNVVVIDKSGNFVTGFKLVPGTPQYDNYIKNGVLR
ncbi:colicin D domain-containing protein [Snodgrassella communis]|uniref:colicin D domain-containing protein n=1 Tax=Snodgrassella communis TaxID=2946699 RepID=UPI001EF46FCA|nr:colicin D domain-containing protein [Snodgrassella communis]